MMTANSIIAELLRFNGAYLPRMLKDLPPESFIIRPEGRGNPIIWLLGHLVLNRGEIVEILGGDPKTGDLGDLFARGTIPASSLSVYPQPSELLVRFKQLAALTDHLLEQADELLMDRQSWGQFETVGQNVAYSYMHETHHIGQISYITNLPSAKSLKKATSFRKPEKKNSTGKLILEGIKSVFA